jgi:uncharacterized protein (DUF488 family)
MPRLWTIGYQEATVDAVLAALGAAGVELLVDVRAVAASRRPGFSKRQLAASLAGIGVDYLHLRGLGTPAAGRLAARTGRHADMRRIFAAHLDTMEARQQLAELAGLVSDGRRACLLCFERRPEHCHRLQVAQSLAELGLAEGAELAITHLLP